MTIIVDHIDDYLVIISLLVRKTLLLTELEVRSKSLSLHDTILLN